jgi:hypothetical protein
MHRGGTPADDQATILEELDASPEALAALMLSLPPERRPALLDSCGDAPPDGRLLIAAWDPFAVVDGVGGRVLLTCSLKGLVKRKMYPVPPGRRIAVASSPDRARDPREPSAPDRCATAALRTDRRTRPFQDFFSVRMRGTPL